MRRFIAAIIIVPILLMGALAVAVGQPASSQTQAATGAPDDRDSYTRNAQEKIHDWQAKVDDFTAKTAAKGQHVATVAETGLQTAWSKTQTEAQRLQTVGATGWDSAKSSFEKASRDMSDAWDKVRPRDN